MQLGRKSVACLFFLVLTSVGRKGLAQEQPLLHVSFDPTRELFQELNQQFTKHREKNGQSAVTIHQSHGASAKQARAVGDGLKADVVSLALAFDVDALVKKSLVAANWRDLLPGGSSPFTSTVVFLVRHGNPKGISNFSDLIKPGIEVLTPHPKTSGGARWNYLAAYDSAFQLNQKDKAKSQQFMRDLFRNVKVLDSGARAATNRFVQRKQGDVLITWESEAFLAQKEFGAQAFQIVVPPRSILAEPVIALVDRVVNQRQSRALAEAYLRYMYSEEAQEIIARHGFRPRSPKVLEKYRQSFPKLELFTIDQAFGGWDKAQQEHFQDGALFDRIYGVSS